MNLKVKRNIKGHIRKKASSLQKKERKKNERHEERRKERTNKERTNENRGQSLTFDEGKSEYNNMALFFLKCL